jgi:hypothetical protein
MHKATSEICGKSLHLKFEIVEHRIGELVIPFVCVF